jgi:uncharacterized protein involved in high-affinity Fe2+ transport
MKNCLWIVLVGFCAVVFACGQKKAADAKPAAPAAPAVTVNAAEDAGFEEFSIGEDLELGPLNVAGLYFQPVDMVPASFGLPAAQADIHIEADISARENDLGYGVAILFPTSR